MNCDEAFERLTDVTDKVDAALEGHLVICPRCRAMRQTLSPALDWFAATSSAEFSEPSHDWSAAWGPLLSEASVAVAMDIARRLPRRSYAQLARKALGIALVAMFGMAFGVLAIGQPPQPADAPTTLPSSTPMTACLWPQRDGIGNLPDTSAQTVIDSCIACHVPAMLRN